MNFFNEFRSEKAEVVVGIIGAWMTVGFTLLPIFTKLPPQFILLAIVGMAMFIFFWRKDIFSKTKAFYIYNAKNVNKQQKRAVWYLGEEKVSKEAIQYVGGNDPRETLEKNKRYSAEVYVGNSKSAVSINGKRYNSVFFRF